MTIASIEATGSYCGGTAVARSKMKPKHILCVLTLEVPVDLLKSVAGENLVRTQEDQIPGGRKRCIMVENVDAKKKHTSNMQRSPEVVAMLGGGWHAVTSDEPYYY